MVYQKMSFSNLENQKKKKKLALLKLFYSQAYFNKTALKKYFNFYYFNLFKKIIKPPFSKKRGYKKSRKIQVFFFFFTSLCISCYDVKNFFLPYYCTATRKHKNMQDKFTLQKLKKSYFTKNRMLKKKRKKFKKNNF